MTTRTLLLCALAFVLAPTVLGLLSVMGRRGDRDPPHVVGRGIVVPAARPPETTLPLAIVVAGNHGTEITDSLPIVETLAASGAFEVRIVAPRRVVSPFYNAGLDFVPDLAFDEYDALVGRAPALIVMPYLLRWETADRAVVGWLRDHAGPDTTVLSICAGAEIVAAAGLFDGHRATANDANLARLTARHPAVRWERDVRWVRDGARVSSGTLAAGIDAALATIDALAGRAAAERAIGVMRYPHARFLDAPAAVAVTPGIATLLEAAFRWEDTSVGVAIDDGVSEAAVAGVMEAYAATISAETIALAPSMHVVSSRHGVRLAPRATMAAAGTLDEVITLPVARDAAFGYDLGVREVERTHGGPQARIAGELMNYPPSHLTLEDGLPLGVTMALRAIAVGALAAAITARLLRGRRRDLRAQLARALATPEGAR